MCSDRGQSSSQQGRHHPYPRASGREQVREREREQDRYHPASGGNGLAGEISSQPPQREMADKTAAACSDKIK
ncbi:hypothetical protein BHE74_00025640 [Ensete ventricosum]|nr:hypothetical protein BHE74_00025640 [Ensete ventricosum]RZS00045.1 hypothetical protein BHM03_00029692 [Ensete ventricosum]